MGSAAEAARKAGARIHAAEDSSSLASAAGDCAPAVAIQQQAVPVVDSSRGESPRVADTPAADAAGDTTSNADETEIELISFNKSDDACD
uniref:Uncharacterized protein n=1 Tax=Peronospora matthiolae TaxID=2874970 RepID=A0AAV1UIV0_9STRA